MIISHKSFRDHSDIDGILSKIHQSINKASIKSMVMSVLLKFGMVILLAIWWKIKIHLYNISENTWWDQSC